MTNENENAISIFSQDDGTHWSREKLEASDAGLPFLIPLNAKSPQAEYGHPNYIEGARAGMLCYSPANELVDVEKVALYALPVYRERVYNEFTAERLRGEMGEWVRSWAGPAAEELVRESTRGDRGCLVTPQQTALVESLVFYAFTTQDLTDLEQYKPAVLQFRSTQIKKAKGWTTRINALHARNAAGEMKPTVPWFGVYQLETMQETSGSYSWWGWKIQPLGKLIDYLDDPEKLQAIHNNCLALQKTAETNGLGSRAIQFESSTQVAPQRAIPAATTTTTDDAGMF